MVAGFHIHSSSVRLVPSSLLASIPHIPRARKTPWSHRNPVLADSEGVLDRLDPRAAALGSAHAAAVPPRDLFRKCPVCIRVRGEVYDGAGVRPDRESLTAQGSSSRFAYIQVLVSAGGRSRVCPGGVSRAPENSCLDVAFPGVVSVRGSIAYCGLAYSLACGSRR